MKDPFFSLPANLPVPQDDGACRHLVKQDLPDLILPSTSGERVNLRQHSGWTVVYVYPMTGRPGVPLPPGWDEIPGARGCTPESCAFRDHYAEICTLGAEVFGLSVQDTPYQQEVRDRLHLPFHLLSDESLALTNALSLPTFQVENMRLLKRFTLIIRSGVIERVFYPIFPTDRHAGEVVSWFRQKTSIAQKSAG